MFEVRLLERLDLAVRLGDQATGRGAGLVNRWNSWHALQWLEEPEFVHKLEGSHEVGMGRAARLS